MTKYVRIMALVLVLATCACLLVSCAGITGKYGNEEKYDYKYTVEGANGRPTTVTDEYLIKQYIGFDGGTVTWTYEKIKNEEVEVSVTLTGKYTISGNSIKFDFDGYEAGETVSVVGDDTVPGKTVADLVTIVDEEIMSFDKGDGYIKLNGKKINKQVIAEQ